ncbi:hypothetical protein AJ85_14385 [Alkalihalobacillus alcalophilus ATCC 27647 = CGMCC 1.3604]|uniref:Uncharacterized protein n=1 Tax=Alkalihalobacillus alcalophilus ATCC 27647 = CGMCC 1.3604 TaxID=1218173 RepID=A0A094WKM3_ALKAL|nr:hypothetical protein [Alkalihalobacillus alcalophilus]KGA98279.1 hypothetical protein BALCAV_0205040 [Alkalihalobacillus alcalophilus ATCC 27647 = CGMCC 1.3604]MED1561597.1 hypothetical protein [Alkalihalobacillus alcalophilus]THG89948.1 hypothetical protein AJ85_14385 [Alkalihalobacillus alcalophilus ATCC 27647 = CGMCC 1.3604]
MILSEFVKFFALHEKNRKLEVILEWENGRKLFVKYDTDYNSDNAGDFPDSDDPENEEGYYEYQGIAFECISIINLIGSEDEKFMEEGELFEITPDNSPDFIKDKNEHILWKNK